MTVENQQSPEPIPAPGPRPGVFEVWLDKQTHREDEVGAVARWVIEDLIKGQWPTSTTLWCYWKREHEEQWRYWQKYLMRGHGFYANMVFFERAHAEYVEADERYMEWWINEFNRQRDEARARGGVMLWPNISNETDPVDEEQNFWARIEREQEARKQAE